MVMQQQLLYGEYLVSSCMPVCVSSCSMFETVCVSSSIMMFVPVCVSSSIMMFVLVCLRSCVLL